MKQKSLQEQLLKAGLVDSSKMKSVRSEKRKQTKQQKQAGKEIVNEARLSAQKAQQEQAEKDRLLNQKHREEVQQKELLVQIKQLVEANKLEQNEEDGIRYNFTDGNKVKSLYLSENIRSLVIEGKLAIVKLEQRYEVVPVGIANKISERDHTCVMKINLPIKTTLKDDPYADYQVPDDLMW
ncbi:MAG: DUF2058 domain-containing protein [Gammaproteobacteria bacterium]